ncbi:MAG: threonylcarbamoyl-AMP synthase [Clostridia bacterium]|nr:threonylcarbamoyl-AMP synthase [Clostridia bacterium]
MEIEEYVEILKNGGVIGVPTDTVYGICTSVDYKDARNKLAKIKGRSINQPFQIMCANIEQIKKIAIVDEKAEKIINKFMPGPITLILSKGENSSKYVNEHIAGIGIRMAPSKELKELIEKLGCPIFLTSANLNGKKECENTDEIRKVFPQLDGIIEGKINYGKASTIVDYTSDTIKILREGPISLEEILKEIN